MQYKYYKCRIIQIAKATKVTRKDSRIRGISMPSFAKNDKTETDATEISMEDVFASGQSEVLLNVRRHLTQTAFLFTGLTYFTRETANAASCWTASQDDPSDGAPGLHRPPG